MSKVGSEDFNERFGVLKLNNDTKEKRSGLEYSPINLGQSQGSVIIDTMSEENKAEPKNRERPWAHNATLKKDQVSNGSEQ